MKRPRGGTVLAIAALAVALAMLPAFGGNYGLRLATTAFMYVTLASAWNLIGGFTGYPSFASAAFFGLGAYVGALTRLSLGFPTLLAWAAGGLGAALFALIIGPAILRLRGHYFAVASLVLAAVLRELVNGATSLTGGGMGLTLASASTLGVDAQARLYYAAMLAVAVASVAIAAAIVHRRLGWAMRCIEQNEDAAMVLGIDTLRVKVAAFAIGAALIGLAGAVYASWIGYIDPTDVFDDLLSVKPIIMGLLGGVGSVLGPVFGAIIFLALEEIVWRNILTFHAGILGLLVVLLLVFLPGGLGGAGQALGRLRLRLWPWREAPSSGRGPAVPS